LKINYRLEPSYVFLHLPKLAFAENYPHVAMDHYNTNYMQLINRRNKSHSYREVGVRRLEKNGKILEKGLFANALCAYALGMVKSPNCIVAFTSTFPGEQIIDKCFYSAF